MKIKTFERPWGLRQREDPLMVLLNGRAPATAPPTAAKQPLLQPEMLTKKQAAAVMSLSTRTVDRLVARGDIPHVRFSKRCVRFPAKALVGWIEARTKGDQRCHAR
jgi:excisionase family DNA binding protein